MWICLPSAKTWKLNMTASQSCHSHDAKYRTAHFLISLSLCAQSVLYKQSWREASWQAVWIVFSLGILIITSSFWGKTMVWMKKQSRRRETHVTEDSWGLTECRQGHDPKSLESPFATTVLMSFIKIMATI